MLASMADLAETIKSRRLARNWSLKELGARIGVTPAYVADIEASRRIPSADLKAKIAVALGITAEELDATDVRLTPDLRDWIEERPPLIGLLRIWESELRAIATEASAWSIETGGDLFGRWNEAPTILLATKAGPNAER